MKFGVRKPNLKKSIRARTTGKIKRKVKRSIPGYGKKGMGWIKNPKRAAYNKIYNKTSIGVSDILKAPSSPKKKSGAKKSRTAKSVSSKSSNATPVSPQANNQNDDRAVIKVPIGEHAASIKDRLVNIAAYIIVFLLVTWAVLKYFNIIPVVTYGIIFAFFLFILYSCFQAWKRDTITDYKFVYEDELTEDDKELLKSQNDNE